MQLIRSLPWDTHYQFSIKTLTLKQIKTKKKTQDDATKRKKKGKNKVFNKNSTLKRPEVPTKAPLRECPRAGHFRASLLLHTNCVRS